MPSYKTYAAWEPGLFEALQGAVVSYPPLPRPEGPLLKAEAPWEYHWLALGRHSVLYDPRDKLFKMWYRAGDAEEPRVNGRFPAYPSGYLWCYATSPDGLRWERPELGIYEHRGSKRNNIFARLDGDNLFYSLVLDLDEPDPERRFKSLGFCPDMPPGQVGVYLGFSPDGLHWRRGPLLADRTVLLDGNSIIGRHPLTGRWMSILRPRTERPKHRFIGVSFSDDYVTWTYPRVVIGMDRGDALEVDFDNLTPAWLDDYFVGLIGVLRNVPPADDVDNVIHGDLMSHQTQLAFSYDGLNWTRPTRDYILPVGSPGSWDSGMVGESTIVRVGDELYIYFNGANRGQGMATSHPTPIGEPLPDGRPASGAIGLIRMPVHRFAAVGPLRLDSTRLARETCLVETRFLNAEGPDPALFLNADTRGGRIRVKVLDHMYRPIPALDFAACEPVSGVDGTAIPVRWNSAAFSYYVGFADQPQRVGPVVKLLFEMQDSTLYSFRFGPS